MQVENTEEVFDRISTNYPNINWLKRPGNRPFAGITTHDPDGNIFDLSQADMENRTDVYTDGEWQQKRSVSHFALRTLNPENCAEFYCNTLGLTMATRAENDKNYYVSDGRISLVLIPWDIKDYAGTGISRTGPDHMAFKVESYQSFKEDYISFNKKIKKKQNRSDRVVDLKEFTYFELINKSKLQTKANGIYLAEAHSRNVFSLTPIIFCMVFLSFFLRFQHSRYDNIFKKSIIISSIFIIQIIFFSMKNIVSKFE